MDEQKIQSIFREAGIEKEIKCPEAFLISEKYGISKTDISRFCNENGIKIRACQLGCFK
ncbi:MAG TPA: hypothetical protein PK154_02980 [Methanoregulaceae archaeon]|jgi:hypothetical protein|nr:hypothetical protein [Methanoregulaceae archaeon]HOB59105.1 hypothetical protein [Methanoregulaceae archaeon]HOH80275.1 hypothetical protein [Methanoregulaceae archaeon]HOU81257.1 hypothetical protein [Methanoregulaceae archaeon]HOW32987.1 hypothetical protein [Methanoregulaceae archaeon]